MWMTSPDRPKPDAGHAHLAQARRFSALREYGSFALAYSATVQAGLDHFGSADGFLAYKQVGSTAFVLSDPIAPLDTSEKLIRSFIVERGDVCFWQSSQPIAEMLARMGFSVNGMGTETRIDLSCYDFKGPRMRNFRRAVKDAGTRGYAIEERAASALDPAELKAVSERWRQTRGVKDREMTFLTRPAVLGDEFDVRKFFTFDAKGRLQAFAFFDPIYAGGKIIGYLNSAKRRLPEADDLVGYAMLHRAIRTFQEEGKTLLSFGLSPLAGIEDTRLAGSALMRAAFRAVFNSRLFNRLVYPLQGFAAHKGAFCGSTQQTYCAFTSGLTLSQLLKMPRACNVM